MRPLILLVLFLAAPQSAAELRSQAQAKEKDGDVDGAIADYTRAINLDPKDAETYGLRAQAKKVKGDTAGAIADYTRLLDLDPKDAPAYVQRGNIRVELRIYGAAIQDFTRAIDLDPENSHLYHFRGRAFYDARFWTSAAADFRKAAQLEKGAWEFPRIHLWLARAKMGDRGPATEELQKYLAQRAPPPGKDYLGQAERFLTGEVTAVDFVESIEADLSEGAKRWRCQAYFLLGECAWLDSDKPAATGYFQKALATKATGWRDYPSAQAALDRLRAEK